MTNYSTEVAAWFKTVDGKYIDMDGKWGAQCTDLAKNWAVKQFGVPNKAYGHGRDVARNLANEPGWTFISRDSAAEPGDVVSWDEGWGGLWEDGELVYYGHVAVVVEDLGSHLKVAQQNPKAPHIATVGKNGLVGYARPPRKQEASASASIKTHTVKAGETFSSIARLYGTSAEALMKLNPGIKPENLLVGTRLSLDGAPKTYTVVAGDTLWGISRKFSVSLDALKAANPTIRPEALLVGDSLTIPSA